MGSSKITGSRKRSRDRSRESVDRHKSRKTGDRKERKLRTLSRSSSVAGHDSKSTSKTSNKKKKRHSSSSSSSKSSSSSSSDSESTKRSKRKAAKAERKERKRLRKAKKKRRESQRSVDEVILVSDPLPASAITEDNKKEMIGPDPKMMQRHSMKPMSKEEWDKQQSVLRHVYDPESGRTRLIKGDGEVMEEIVTYEQHLEINKKATEGDGNTFQAKLGLQKKTLFNRTKMTSSTTKKKKSS